MLMDHFLSSVFKEVKAIFKDGLVLDYLNDMLVTLIPKCKTPKSLNNYRPISLCNSVYKIVSKNLVERIRPYLNKLVSPIQSAFMPERKGLDNVLVAQELFYALDGKKGKEGYMAIKVDLEKAYDRLEWCFIHKVLQAFHFPQNIVKVIMSRVTSTKISILFNGEALESFNPSRGIRQGDPLSSYLFILCMEYLGHLIYKKCMEGVCKPLKASRDNIGISHLFFADDLILFAKVDEDSCETISEVLDEFCEESGQKVSVDKSRIYFSPNVQAKLRREICSRLGIQAMANIGNYLGFPIKHKGVPWNRMNFMVERVMNKLAGWKARFLSFVGRSVLVKSVMSSIPNYVMQAASLPAHLCEKLDKINQDFLWGSTSEKRRLHLVGWSKIIRPKEEGGLGIQAARAKNLALLAKLKWRMYQEKESLWAKVILRKYCLVERRRARDLDKLPASPNWRAIKAGFQIFADGICWGVGNGERVKLWIDSWIKGSSLRELIEGPLTQRETDMKLSKLLLRSIQEWKWEVLSFELPLCVKDKIKAISRQQVDRGEDVIMWKFSKDGEFTTKFAYALLNDTHQNSLPFQGQWIWKIDTLPRIVSFLWLCMHNSLLVRSMLAMRGIIPDSCYPLCNNFPETISHLLRDCVVAKDF